MYLSESGVVGRPVQFTTALAQRLVDELAPALHENLNLMDAGGFIIGSRDVNRVGTLHPGAREAASTGRTVDVHASTMRPGEQPGVNLPLEHRGRVIGVVGITGEPERVRSLASVMALTILLLIERETELAGESQRDAADRALLARLVYGSRPEDAVTVLEKRHPALPGPWGLIAAVARDLRPEVGALGAVDAYGAEAPGSPLPVEPASVVRRGIADPVLVGELRGIVWVLATCSEERGAAHDRGRKIQALATDVAAMLPERVIIHTGVCETSAELVREAGSLAALTTRAELLAPPKLHETHTATPPTTRSVQQLRFQLVAAQLPLAIVESLASPLAGVSSAEIDTLRAYLEAGSAAELARSGYTHRNTVQRRLKNIEQRTGYNLRVPTQAGTLALALAASDELGAR